MEDIQKAYDLNASYQFKAKPPRDQVVEELKQDYANAAPQYFGRGGQYASFLAFYESEINKMGWEAVLSEYLFGTSDVCRQLFARLYSGFLHPMIQLMFGVEWSQPVIVAEALAQAAVHSDRLGEFLTKAETLAAERNPPHVAFASLFENLRTGGNEKLIHSAQWTDPNRVYDGVMVRAPEEALDLVAGVKVKEEDLDERTAEMIHTTAYVAAAAAWHPPHIPKFDFFLM